MWDKRADTVVHEREPYNAEPVGTALDGHRLTPLDTFYSRNHGPVPEIDPATWRLSVTGLVDRPLDLTLADLRARYAEHAVVATLQCAGARRAGFLPVRDIPGEAPWGAGAVSTARWTGVRLADVLADAGLRADAAHVAFTGPDVSQLADPPQPFGGSIPRTKAVAPEVLLAWGMNGAPLPPVHGGPVRVVVPGWVGARSVKWVTRVQARTDPSDNYFQAMSYRLLPPEADPDRAGPGDGLSLGPVALNADFLAPADGSTHPGPSVTVSGYAYAGQDREVVRVDVSTDDGATWRQAHLDEPDGPWAWTLWRAEVDLGPGRTRVCVRAWDCTGASQPEHPASLWNPKGYVNNAWGRLTLRRSA